jgi:sugar/nucleoside kinase (ribokinase family)
MDKKRTSSSREKPGRPIVLGSGLLALDIVLSEVSGAPPRFWAGGTCGNVLIALQFLGWAARPIARLRPGLAADQILADLDKWSVSKELVSVSDDGSTPIIVERITQRESQSPRHSFSWRCPTCGSHFPGFKPVLASVAESITEKLGTPQVFFFDRATPSAVILARASAVAGALVVFEPSGIGNPVVFQQAWQASHVVKYSHERLSELPEIPVEDGPLLQVETLGESGLRFRRFPCRGNQSSWSDLPALSALEFRDSAGAGDWCTAGFLSRAATEGLDGFREMNNKALSEAFRYGQALAAWNCGYEGARGGMYEASRQSFSRAVLQILAGRQRNKGTIHLNTAKRRHGLDTYCFTCQGSEVVGRSKNA